MTTLSTSKKKHEKAELNLCWAGLMPFSQAYCSPSSSFPIDLPCPILRLSTKEAKKRKMSENQQWQKIDNMIKKGKVTSLSSAANTADEGLLTSLEYPTIFTEFLSINDEHHCQPLQLLHVARIFHTQILSNPISSNGLTFALTNSDWMFSCLVDVRPTKSCTSTLW